MNSCDYVTLQGEIAQSLLMFESCEHCSVQAGSDWLPGMQCGGDSSGLFRAETKCLAEYQAHGWGSFVPTDGMP